MKSLQMEKKQRMEECALQLFLAKGIDETSVNDIVKNANLAKGTFYVYFKDKQALIDEVIIRHNIQFFNEILANSKQLALQYNKPWSFIYLRCVMDYYIQHPNMLRMVHQLFHESQGQEIFVHNIKDSLPLFQEFLSAFQLDTETTEAAMQRFQLMMGMTGIVCHRAIIYQQPDTMDVIDPLFYHQMCLSFARGKECSS